MPNLPFPTDLMSFIAWLGSAAGIGFVQATLFEQLPGWGTLPANIKRLIVFAFSMLMPVLSAWLLGAAKPEQITVVQWYLNLALQGLFIWATSQWTHAKDPARPKVEVSQTVTEKTGTVQTGTVEKTVSVVTSDAKTTPPDTATPATIESATPPTGAGKG